MTHGIIEDSDRFCPWHSKRMLVEIGQSDQDGALECIHFALCCDYRESDTDWKNKRVVQLAPRSPGVVASSLYRMRERG
jgi:hypothetical protein